MRKLLFSLLLLAELCIAFDRPLPPNAKLGKMQAYSGQAVEIDGEIHPGGAGLRVYSTDGRIIMPQTVPQQSPILYQLEPSGQVWKIWLLTDEEAATIKRQRKAVKEAAAQQ